MVIIAAVVALLLVVSAYGGVIDPRKSALPSLVSMALPFVSVAAVVSLVLFAVFHLKWSTVIVAVAIVLSLPSIRLVWPMSWSSSPRDGSQSFTMMTWNVCGFRPEVARRVMQSGVDVVVLQEASVETENYIKYYLPKSVADSIKACYPYHTQGGSDVVIMSRVPFTLVADTTMRNRWGLYGEGTYHIYGRIYDLDIDGHPLRVVGMHLQPFGLNGSDKELYKDVIRNRVNTRSELREVKHSLVDKIAGASIRRADEAHAVRDVRDSAPGNAIVCGDFNDTPGSYTYRTIKGNDFADSFVKCGTLPVNTYHNDGFYFKIDHMLYRGDLKAVSTRRERWTESDHYPIITTFEWTAP